MKKLISAMAALFLVQCATAPPDADVPFRGPVQRPPGPEVTGHYRLVAVNGNELPVTTWRLRNRDCEIRTISGWLALEQGNNWSSGYTEEEWCREEDEEEQLSTRTSRGIFAVEGERILLESSGYVDSAVLQGGQLELTVRGLGFRHGQTAVYTFRLPQDEPQKSESAEKEKGGFR